MLVGLVAVEHLITLVDKLNLMFLHFQDFVYYLQLKRVVMMLNFFVF